VRISGIFSIRSQSIERRPLNLTQYPQTGTDLLCHLLAVDALGDEHAMIADGLEGVLQYGLEPVDLVGVINDAWIQHAEGTWHEHGFLDGIVGLEIERAIGGNGRLEGRAVIQALIADDDNVLADTFLNGTKDHSEGRVLQAIGKLAKRPLELTKRLGNDRLLLDDLRVHVTAGESVERSSATVAMAGSGREGLMKWPSGSMAYTAKKSRRLER
jgi:hypothetical protein